MFSIYEQVDIPSDPSLPPTGLPLEQKTDDCDLASLVAGATFTAPSATGLYVVRAHMDPYVTVNPDVPDRIDSLDLDTYDQRRRELHSDHLPAVVSVRPRA